MTSRQERGRHGQPFGTLEKIWKSNVPIKINLKNPSCLSILLYGSETWLLQDTFVQQINPFATSCYRVMLNTRRDEHVTNRAVYEAVKQQPHGQLRFLDIT